MAVIAQIVLRGLSPAQYDAVRTEVDWFGRPAAGGISHVTWWQGPDCHIIDAWESAAAFEAFAADRLGPGMARLGITAAPDVTFHQAHEVYTATLVKLT